MAASVASTGMAVQQGAGSEAQWRASGWQLVALRQARPLGRTTVFCIRCSRRNRCQEAGKRRLTQTRKRGLANQAGLCYKPKLLQARNIDPIPFQRAFL